MRMLALVVSLLLALPAMAANPTYDAEGPDLAASRRAYRLFLKACPNIPRAIRQSSTVDASPNTGYPDEREEYGWSTIMVVRMELADGTGLMPPVLVNTSSMRDAWFILAGQPRPGVLPMTGAARAICGMKAARQDGEHPLIPVPALAFLPRQWQFEKDVAAMVRRRKPGCPDPDIAYRLGERPPTPAGCD